MSILYMGFSFGDELEKKEEMMVQLKDESRESRNSGIMDDLGINGFDLETEFEFWPVQHPSEPSHEDRPVQCPMPHSSPLINDRKKHDDRLSDRKRPDSSAVLGGNMVQETAEPPVRAVRKRHHTLTLAHQDHTPLLQFPTRNTNTTVFETLRQVHGFES